LDLNEVCQPGVDEWDLPSWCVGYSLSIDTILQLVIEIFILLLVFSTCYAYFDWKRKKKLEKEIIRRKQEEEYAKNALN
jgi:hypothetical protein